VWREVVGGTYLEVIRPIRQPKSKLVKDGGIERATQLAANILASEPTNGLAQLILILIDADNDCPAQLGPSLEARARHQVSAVDVACVIANIEYETWLIGGASSLVDWVDFHDAQAPSAPEERRHGKGWLINHWRATKYTSTYSETADQPRLSSRFHLEEARRGCPSFDKLCRTLGSRLER
jgi:hypothetical protein